MSDDQATERQSSVPWRLRWPMLCVVAVLAIGACTPVGCTPPKPPAPKTNACAADGDIRSSLSRRLGAGEAATRAADAFEEGVADPALDDSAGVPLVIVQREGDDFTYESVTVDDADEAREVGRRSGTTGEVVSVEVDLPVTLSVETPPDDPLYPTAGQWGLHPARTTFQQAWGSATGDGIVIAVLDTGVDAGHPDLAGKVLPGRNFTNQGTVTNTSDQNGHGTHVAGIAAAVHNNVGIAGAAPDVQILPVKVMGSTGNGQISWVVNGMKWARLNGADLITMSLGSAKSGLWWPEIVAAWDGGVPMVAAVGNDGDKTMPGYAKGVHCSWPSGYEHVLGVASTSRSGAATVRSSFSNRGPQVDLGAPGDGICSTVPTWANVNAAFRCVTGLSTGYAVFDGTSMAAPFVAAQMALLMERCPKPDNAAASSFYRTRMRKSGNTYPSKNIDLGYGRISPAKALQGSCATP